MRRLAMNRMAYADQGDLELIRRQIYELAERIKVLERLVISDGK